MARVDEGALLADDVEIGPFCSVGPQVELRAGVQLLSHVNVTGVTTVGERTVIHPFASLGTPPQSNAYRGGATRLSVGADCRIREGVTINTGSEDGGGITLVGDRCFLMANSHIGHDCAVGDDATLANGVLLGGHVRVGNHVFIGGNTSVHQHVRVGENAMIGGSSGVTDDVIPFGLAFGQRAVLIGLNVVGLKRRGFSRADAHRLRRTYRALFMGAGQFNERFAQEADAFASDPVVGKVIAFIREGGSRRLMKTAVSNGIAESAEDS